MVDYAVNPRVRNAGKGNFLADKNGNGVAMLIELQGRAITPKPFKMRNNFKYKFTLKSQICMF